MASKHIIRLIELYTWLKSLYVCIFICSSVFFVYVYFCIVGVSVSSVKLAGLFFQILGFIMTFMKVFRARSKFKSSNFFRCIMKKIEEFSKIFSNKKVGDIHAQGAIELPLLECSGYASSFASLEENVAELKELLFKFKDEYKVFSHNIDARFLGLTDNLQRNVKRLDESIEKLHDIIKDIAVGDGHVPYVEIAFFLVGSCISAFPEELVCTYQRWSEGCLFCWKALLGI